jgi:hypothetical protein
MFMTPTGCADMEPTYGDRRDSRRYQLNLELRYKVTRGRHLVEMGTGQTVDVSSGGVSFSTSQFLPPGAFAELWLEWPVALNGNALRLVMQGRVVRSEGNAAAVQISRHEFRLAGRAVTAGAQPAAVCPIGTVTEMPGQWTES